METIPVYLASLVPYDQHSISFTKHCFYQFQFEREQHIFLIVMHPATLFRRLCITQI